tara:strand:+ start:391 stop:798 length:408 start_codon:yes stop_codon:yes gene_type:complete
MSIRLKDSELYDILLEVCQEIGYDQYMPESGCLFESADGGKAITVWATAFKTAEPFKRNDNIKAYIKECIESTLAKSQKCSFYPYSILKSDNNTRLILRGAIQQEGWLTITQDIDKEFNKSILDKVERGRELSYN